MSITSKTPKTITKRARIALLGCVGAYDDVHVALRAYSDVLANYGLVFDPNKYWDFSRSVGRAGCAVYNTLGDRVGYFELRWNPYYTDHINVSHYVK